MKLGGIFMGNKKEQSAIIPDKTLVEKMVSEYELLRNQEKQISERKKVLAKAIKLYAFANGTKDDSGSFYSDNDTFTYGAQCKKSVKFDVDKASKFLQSKGFEECIKLVPEIVETAVEKRVSEGDISVDELESITVTSTSFAVMVKSKDIIAEDVQQTAIAASRKKPVLKRRK